MYICNNCGETFEEPKIYEEHHPYGMGYATEEFAVCPHCGEGDIEEAYMCCRCDEYVAQTFKGLCEACYDEVYGEGGEG